MIILILKISKTRHREIKWPKIMKRRARLFKTERVEIHTQPFWPQTMLFSTVSCHISHVNCSNKLWCTEKKANIVLVWKSILRHMSLYVILKWEKPIITKCCYFAGLSKKKKIYSKSSNKVIKLMGMGEIDFPTKATDCEICMCPPHLRGFSPGSPISSHIPKMYTLGKLVCLYCTRLSALWGGSGVCVSAPAMEGLVLPAALSCQDRLPPTTILNWNKRIGI